MDEFNLYEEKKLNPQYFTVIREKFPEFINTLEK